MGSIDVLTPLLPTYPYYPYPPIHLLPYPRRLYPRNGTTGREGMVGRGPVGIYRVLGVDVDTSRTCIPLYPPHTLPVPGWGPL